METKYCPKCGAANKNDAYYCNDCGYSFIDEKPQKNNKGLIALLIIIALVVFGVFFGGKIYFDAKQKEINN